MNARRLCCRYERHKVTKWIEGAVYQTKHVHDAWFPMGHGPETNMVEGGHMWCPTMSNPEYREDYLQARDER